MASTDRARQIAELHTQAADCWDAAAAEAEAAGDTETAARNRAYAAQNRQRAADAPTEGRCELCGQKRPLFPFTFTAHGNEDTARLCVRDYSKAGSISPEKLDEQLFHSIGHSVA